MQETLISSLTERLFSAVSGEGGEDRPPLPAFIYGGRVFNPRQWERDISSEESGDESERYLVTYSSPDHLLKLELHFTIYSEYPVVEWQVFLHACGKGDTQEIDAFRSISLDMPLGGCESVIVRRNYGCKSRYDDFQPRNVELTGRYPDNHLRMDADETGASAAWLPYINVDLDEESGFELGIGWPGNWNLDLTLDADTLFLEAGMKRSRFVMKAGERFRCPSVYVMLRDGINIYEAQVVHRHFLHDCHSCKGGKQHSLQPQQAVVFPGNIGAEALLKWLGNGVDKSGIQAVELNGGWNGERCSTMAGRGADSTTILKNLGDWHVNAESYPNSLSEVAAAAHKYGLSFILWLDLLTACKDSPMVKAHPQWYLASTDSQRPLLLNLGMGDARSWAEALLKEFIVSEKVDGFAIPTPDELADYWENSEKGTRQGATEALFIYGLYELLAGICRLYPDVIFYMRGSSFSDFESISRCIAHFDCGVSAQSEAKNINYLPGRSGESDYGRHGILRIANLAQYLPSFTGMGTIIPGSEANLASCLNLFSGRVESPAGYGALQLKHASVLHRLQQLFDKDFHLLESSRQYVAYQLHDAVTGSGALLFLRSEAVKSPVELALNQIDTRAKYTIEDGASEELQEIKGTELAAYSLKLDEDEAALLLFYSRTHKKH